MSFRSHSVRVQGLPAWLDRERLLGPAQWEFAPAEGEHPERAMAQLTPGDAADLQARLRGMGIGGTPVIVEVDPPLPRRLVRAARSDEARRQRDTTPGWLEPRARASGEGRYSLTPEAIALDLAKDARGLRVVDACAGAGGNSVGFARAGCDVTAIEPDAERLAELHHNLAVYGVESRVQVLAGTLQAKLPDLTGDLLFADPPWGERYDRLCCRRDALPLLEPVLAARPRFGAVWLKLPPSFDVGSLSPLSVQAYFGCASGDRRRVKFLLAKL